jgi:hypothetical protein
MDAQSLLSAQGRRIQSQAIVIILSDVMGSVAKENNNKKQNKGTIIEATSNVTRLV